MRGIHSRLCHVTNREKRVRGSPAVRLVWVRMRAVLPETICIKHGRHGIFGWSLGVRARPIVVTPIASWSSLDAGQPQDTTLITLSPRHMIVDRNACSLVFISAPWKRRVGNKRCSLRHPNIEH